MTKFFYQKLSSYEIRLRSQNLASSKNQVLDKSSREATVKLYEDFIEGEEIALKNQSLEQFLGYGNTKTKQVIKSLLESGVIYKTVKPYSRGKSYNCSHYTLAKLPELTLAQIDFLIDQETEAFWSPTNKPDGTPYDKISQSDKLYYEYKQRINRLVFLRMQYPETHITNQIIYQLREVTV